MLYSTTVLLNQNLCSMLCEDKELHHFALGRLAVYVRLQREIDHLDLVNFFMKW